MALVDWTEKAGLRQQLQPADAEGHETEWILELSGGLIHSLSAELESLYGSDSSRDSELRLELPDGWRLFWKERSAGEGTLLFVAHPELEQWVGTLALEPEFARGVISRLRGLKAHESFSLRSLGTRGSQWSIAALSNFNLIFTRSSI
ncbi:MAG: hypothetical protein A2X94_16430 [Bdellovibrionales bacterium GWB1_55_8]|nr:MAG: hypothetical protein A2X94_16430 [Bdellovibrionales bacterium GWB1_55_8]